MADNVLFTPLRALDANNAPIPGARAYFFRTGTSTAETVYQDTAATTPHTIPVLADSNGGFPPVYSSGAYTLRCVIRDAGEVQVSDIDPIWTTPLTTGAASTVSFTPTSDIAKGNVQDAIEQVQNNWTGAKSGADSNLVSGTAGTEGNLLKWNADGDAVDSGYGVVDEDDMASDDDTKIPTAQSVKAYVDNSVDGLPWTWLDLTATTSESNKDFTGLPSGIVEVEIFLDQVSSDGTGDFLVQFGTGGSPTTSGYISYGGTAGAADSATETTGFVIPHNNAARTSVGRMRITNISGNTWVADYTGGISTPAGAASGGSVTLGGVFDNIRFTCGLDTFDSGQIRARYR